MPHDCRAIANAVLDLADSRHVPLTPMGLQKVMYYAHGWYLAAHGEPLIRQDFQAWRDGPVQRIVWDCFKGFGSAFVTARAERLDLVTRERVEVREALPAQVLKLLGDVVAGYGHIDARELSTMTHEGGGPWDEVWNAPDGRITLGMVIPNDSIRNHFRRAAGRELAS